MLNVYCLKRLIENVKKSWQLISKTQCQKTIQFIKRAGNVKNLLSVVFDYDLLKE